MCYFYIFIEKLHTKNLVLRIQGITSIMSSTLHILAVSHKVVVPIYLLFPFIIDCGKEYRNNAFQSVINFLQGIIPLLKEQLKLVKHWYMIVWNAYNLSSTCTYKKCVCSRSTPPSSMDTMRQPLKTSTKKMQSVNIHWLPDVNCPRWHWKTLHCRVKGKSKKLMINPREENLSQFQWILSQPGCYSPQGWPSNNKK